MGLANSQVSVQRTSSVSTEAQIDLVRRGAMINGVKLYNNNMVKLEVMLKAGLTRKKSTK